MTSFPNAADTLDWADIASQLDLEGYARLPGWLAPGAARALAQALGATGPRAEAPPAGAGMRPGSTASGDTLAPPQARLFDAEPAPARGWEPLARSGLGEGDLRVFAGGLPEPLAAWRETFYRHLAPIANRWNETLAVPYRYPATLGDFLERNRQAGQTRPLSHLTRLRESGYVALHQRSDGEHVFPLQVVLLLSAPGEDFAGGEFVMTEQRPRMQSRPLVLPLRLGDAALITTAVRPVAGSKGAYRVNLRHAVSRVRSGVRVGLELSFHDGL